MQFYIAKTNFSFLLSNRLAIASVVLKTGGEHFTRHRPQSLAFHSRLVHDVFTMEGFGFEQHAACYDCETLMFGSCFAVARTSHGRQSSRVTDNRSAAYIENINRN